MFKRNDGWADVIDREFANHNALDLAINNYIHFTSNQKWLFFVGTKLFGCANNWVLNYAANNASTVKDFIKCIYRSILSVAHTDKKFRMYYNQRKIVLDQLGNPINEVVDFCKVVISKGQNALHYLTDNSQKERELVFSLLDKYGSDYTKEQLIKILEDVYPDLCAYLSDYRFKNTLLDNYFSQYKYQKVINKLLPEFVDIVAEQAEKREYTLTQPRFAFWVGQGYQTFHLRSCPKLQEVSNLRGFGTYKEAIRAGYTPCRKCRPTAKHDAKVSIPITNRVRENEKIEDLEAMCNECGYSNHREGAYLYLETPVGKWRINVSESPVKLDHINLVKTPGVKKYHEQPRIFLSFIDTFDYIKRHDDELEKKAAEGRVFVKFLENKDN